MGIKRSKNHKEQTEKNPENTDDTRNKFRNTHSSKEHAVIKHNNTPVFVY